MVNRVSYLVMLLGVIILSFTVVHSTSVTTFTQPGCNNTYADVYSGENITCGNWEVYLVNISYVYGNNMPMSLFSFYYNNALITNESVVPKSPVSVIYGDQNATIYVNESFVGSQYPSLWWSRTTLGVTGFTSTSTSSTSSTSSTTSAFRLTSSIIYTTIPNNSTTSLPTTIAGNITTSTNTDNTTSTTLPFNTTITGNSTTININSTNVTKEENSIISTQIHQFIDSWISRIENFLKGLLE